LERKIISGMPIRRAHAEMLSMRFSEEKIKTLQSE
jgi:hypothetical protein